VKPHGALYTMAARDGELAAAIVRAVASVDRSLVVYGPPDSELLKAGRAIGLRTAAEGFADRGYEPDGSLMARGKTGAVLSDPSVVVARALRLVSDHIVVAANGAPLALRIDTLCVHGDTPGADDLAARLRAGLDAAGVMVRPPGD
jgi:UPF0271 protein